MRLRTQKGSIILTTTHMVLGKSEVRARTESHLDMGHCHCFHLALMSVSRPCWGKAMTVDIGGCQNYGPFLGP